MAEAPTKCVVLLSGGLDSATTLAVARDRAFDCHAISFDYGQRHRFELDAARRVASSLGAASHDIVRIDTSVFGDTSLTGDGPAPMKDRSSAEIGAGIPDSYVPARNLVFLSFGVAAAEAKGASHVFIGANAIDYSGYPDCRPAFIESFGRTAALATKAGVEGSPISIEAPLITLTKAEIIKLGARLGVDYSVTHSCYDPDDRGLACGRCDSCQIRRQGFADAGVPDPTPYAVGAPA
jgi:7-cyano-7-deazaguanine synthase